MLAPILASIAVGLVSLQPVTTIVIHYIPNMRMTTMIMIYDEAKKIVSSDPTNPYIRPRKCFCLFTVTLAKKFSRGGLMEF